MEHTTPEGALLRYLRSHFGEDRKAPVIRPFRDEHHAGLVLEPPHGIVEGDLVLIPGWTSLGDGMATLGYYLARMGFRVHLLLLPGFGGPKTGRYNIQSLVNYIKSYIKREGIRPTLVGHSMSGEVVKHVARSMGLRSISLAPAGPRKWRRILDWAVAPLGVFQLLKNARRLGVDVEYLDLLSPLRYMKVVGMFGGWRGNILLGAEDRLVPLTDVFYTRSVGARPISAGVFKGGHGFFTKTKNIVLVARIIAHLAKGSMGRQ